MKFIPSFAIEINVVNLLDFIKREFDETIYLICNDTVFLKLCMITAILLFVVDRESLRFSLKIAFTYHLHGEVVASGS